MSEGHTTNGSNTRARTLASVRATGKVLTWTFETVVLAEILWYYLHDGEQTLHGALAEWLEERRYRAQHRASVRHTRDMIRDLPET